MSARLPMRSKRRSAGNPAGETPEHDVIFQGGGRG